MAKKDEGPKLELEREYIVPLRKGWLKVPKYKRVNKAVKTLKEFMARHMKIYDNDLRKIKVDIELNNELRFKGIKKPPAKIKVKARKYDDGNVKVGLVDVPKHLEFARLRELKKVVKKKEGEKKDKKEEKKVDKVDEEKLKKEEIDEEGEDEEKEEEKKVEDKKEEKIKKDVKPEMKVKQKQVSKDKGVRIQRKALGR